MLGSLTSLSPLILHKMSMASALRWFAMSHLGDSVKLLALYFRSEDTVQLTRNEEDCYQNNEHGYAHETQWEAPSEAGIAVSNSEIDPVGQENAQKVAHEDKREGGTSIVCL